MPRLFADARRALDASRDLGMDRDVRLRREGDSESLRLSQPLKQRTIQLCPIGVAGQVAGHRVKSRRRVLNRAGQDAVCRQAGPALALDRTARDPAPRRLEPYEAAA